MKSMEYPAVVASRANSETAMCKFYRQATRHAEKAGFRRFVARSDGPFRQTDNKIKGLDSDVKSTAAWTMTDAKNGAWRRRKGAVKPGDSSGRARRSR